MRFIVSLVLLIRLADAAESAPVFAEPTRQGAASPTGVLQLTIDQGMTPSLAPSLRSPERVSSEEVISVWELSPVEPGANAEPDLSNTPHVIPESEIERAIRIALGQPTSEMRLEITAHSREVLPAGQAEFPLAGASKPSPLHPEAAVLWRGYWRTPDGHRIPIWARVRALRPRPVVRLRVDVPGGTTLSASLLEQVSVLNSAFRTDPQEALTVYEGKVLRHFAKAGSVISLKQIMDPPLVLRNSMVRVDVISGSLHLLLKARAETDGQAGESIRLVIPCGHRQFLATIQPDGSAVLKVALANSGSPPSARGDRNEL